MAEDYGTAKLLKLLEKVKRMTVEEYNDLYDRTLKNISEIIESGADFEVLVSYGPTTQAELNYDYREPGGSVFLSFDPSQVYSFRSSHLVKYDVEEVEMAEAA